MTVSGLLVADLVVGALLVALGIVAGRMRAPGATRWLLLGASVSWLLGDLLPAATFAHRALLVHLVLASPSGRLRAGAPRVVVGAGYVYGFVYLFARSDVITLGLAAAVVAAAVAGLRVATGPARRDSAVTLVASVDLAAALGCGAVARLAHVGTESGVLLTYDVLLATVAVLVVGGLVWLRLAVPGVTALVVDLGDDEGSNALRDRLARGLGDPSLVVGYWLPERETYVDEAGNDLGLPRPGPEREVTPIAGDGGPLAVLVHDPAVVADHRLVADVAAAARWAVENVRLRADVRAQVASVAASRRRLVTAADDERRRLEAALREGTEQRLARVRALVGADGSALGDLAERIDHAREDVGALARGLHPRSLVEAGMRAALEELTAGSAVPVTLDVPTTRLPPAVETAAYFICAEALANTTKHARAASAAVRLTTAGSAATLVVSDTGVGGADLAAGTGLLGLADRAEAVGGRLAVQSEPGHGTTITVTLPLEVPDPVGRPVVVS
jgi:signal transduction histidine kinase